jgi:nitrile hydratase subunit beta
MDGIHDLGGMQGFGPVEVEDDEPTFHERWEGRVFGMTGMATLQGLASTSEFRHAIERMDPADYLTTSYYEHWLTALGTLLVEKGAVAGQELEGGAPAGFLRSRPVLGDRAPRPPARGSTASFEVGDRVRVADIHTPGHTRCPRYVRGATGVVEAVRGNDPLPDIGPYKGPVQPVYAVAFDSEALFGPSDDGRWTVMLDLFEDYLEDA